MIERYFLLLLMHSFTTAFFANMLYMHLSTFAIIYSKIAHVILYAFITFFTFGLSKKYFYAEKILPVNKAVLITGCDSGFGYNLAKRLDSRGFKVFAACLFPHGEGAMNLKNNCSEKLEVLYINVRDEACITNAVNFIKENLGNYDFWALINNAGIFKGHCVELTSLGAFRDSIDVNSLGVVRMTKAFLPLLKLCKGRVINITSNSGRVARQGLCAYTMSKYATVAFTECLSQEMNVWGVNVISVEPELFRTQISDIKAFCTGLDEEVRKNSQEILVSYGEDFIEKYKKYFSIILKWASPRVDIVINEIESAVMDKYPNYVYKPRRNLIVRSLFFFEEILPFTFTRYVYIKLCDILCFPVPKDFANVHAPKKE